MQTLLRANTTSSPAFEVLEHVEEREAIRAIAAMTAAATRLLFSSGPTDLEKPTHINTKPVIWWLHRFAEAGMSPIADYDASFLAPHAYFDRPKGEAHANCAPSLS